MMDFGLPRAAEELINSANEEKDKEKYNVGKEFIFVYFYTCI